MILLRSFLSGHIRIKRTLEYYDAGIGPRVPFGGGFGPTVSANFAVALGDFDSLSSTSTMPTGGSISRAGNAMLYDSTGKLTYAPNNLLTFSQDYTQTIWLKTAGGTGSAPTVTANTTTAPDGTTTASTVVFNTGAGTSTSDLSLLQRVSGAITSGISYIGSIYVKGSVGTQILYRQVGAATFTKFTLTGGWDRLSTVETPSSATINVDIGLRQGLGGIGTINSSATVYVWGAQLEAVTYQTTPSTYVATTTAAYYGPRFDYDPVTLQPKGLLVEGTRTNVATYSQNFATTGTDWAGFGSVPATTSTGFTSPDGTSNAWKISAGNAQYGGLLRNSTIILGASTTYVVSCYVKAGNVNYFGIRPGGNGATSGVYTFFNLSTGVATVNPASGGTILSADMKPVGNSWYRCWLVYATSTSTTGTFDIGITNSSGSTIFNPGSGDNLYVWGLQVEAGGFITSYLPNGASSSGTARAAETFSLTGYANRLVEAYYIDEETGANYSGNSALSTGTVTINPPTFGWVTSLRAYTNAYAGSISTPSWLSFSRAGNAMYYDSTGTLTYAPSNLVINSNTFNATGWNSTSSGTSVTSGVSDPLGGTNAWTVTATSTNGYFYSVASSQQLSANISGAISSVWIRRRTGTGTVRLRTNVASVDTPITVTSTWTRVSVNVSGFDGSGNTWVMRIDTNGDAVDIFQAQLEPVTYQTAPSAYIPTTSAAVYQPRYDYDPSTVPATPRGLLIEEQRANLLTYSEQFDNAAWTAGFSGLLAFGSGSVANATVAPDGTSNADKIVEDTTPAASHRFFNNIAVTVTSGASVAYSIYVKAAGRTSVRIADNNLVGVTFDLTNGSTSSVSGSVTTSSAQNVGNGWWRLSFAAPSTASVSGRLILYLVSGGTTTYTGDGVSGVFVWGAQLENSASFATSYIPTTTASVTRAADVAQLTGSALTTLQGANWTFMGEVGRIPSASVTAGVIGTNSFGVNAIRFNGSATDLLTWQNNGSTYNFITPVSALTNNTRIGLSGNASGTSSVASNGTVVTGGTVSWAVGAYLGYGASAGGSPLNSTYRSLAIYNQRLPDTILRQKSTVGAPY